MARDFTRAVVFEYVSLYTSADVAMFRVPSRVLRTKKGIRLYVFSPSLYKS